MSARDMIAVCQRNIRKVSNSSDCSAFVNAVAQECGVLIVGDANAIISGFPKRS